MNNTLLKTTPLLTLDQFRTQWSMLKPGKMLKYHVGHLITDRTFNSEIDAVAKRAFYLGAPDDVSLRAKDNPLTEKFGIGVGHLFQKRVGNFKYEYYIQKKVTQAQPKRVTKHEGEGHRDSPLAYA